MKKIILAIASIVSCSCVKENSYEIKYQLINKSLSVTRIEGYIKDSLVYENTSPQQNEIIKEYTKIGGFDATGGVIYQSYFDSLIVYTNDKCARFTYSTNSSKTYPSDLKNINSLSNSEPKKIYKKKNKLETIYYRQYIDDSIVSLFVKCN